MPNMQKILDIKNRILQIVKEKGPELPVRVAGAIGQNNIFTAAFMSELVGEQKLKLSNMRVGSSPLYYIQGQEEQLQRYTEYLNHKEKEAFKLLKEKEILSDSEQEPAIRVALRSIKDFASQIRIINNGEEKTFWKIHTLSNEKAKEIIEIIITPKIQKQEIKEEQALKVEKTESKEIKPQIDLNDIKGEKIDSVEKPQVKKKEKQALSSLLNNIKDILTEKNIEILNEILVKKKEFAAKVKVKTHFGEQEFYFVAKDKKKITLDDLVSTLQKAQAEKMPALIMSNGEIDKKAQAYYDEWSNLIKHKKINF